MRLLVVGLGSVGQRHVRCLRQLYGDEVEILAYRQRGRQLEITADLRARETCLEELYGIRSFRALDDALAESPRAALVCTPNHLHLPLATRLVEAGLDLFLEKPVSHSLDGIAELEARLQARGRICCVGYQLRFHPGVERMIEAVRGGAIGEPFACHVDFGEHMPYWHRYEDYSETFMARAAEGGGVTLTQIHDLDLILALFGVPDSVFASGGSSGALRMDAEDHVSSLLTYRRDGRPLVASLDQDCLRYPPRRSYEVRGILGTVRFDYYRNELTRVPFDGEAVVEYADAGFRRDDLFVRQMRHFVACLRREEAPRVGLSEGADSLRMALAVRDSMASGREVRL
jgi:predicted dehydrogenase